jgi:hypothetical protein
MIDDALADSDLSGPVLRGTLVHAHHAAAKAHCLSARAHLQSGDHRRLAVALLAARLHIIDALKHSGLADHEGTAACDLTRSLAWKLMGGSGGRGDGVGEHLDALERLLATLGAGEPGAGAPWHLVDRAPD